jgi:heme/copper-type cytochrome/quinol oxidase subunit 2
MITIVSRCFLCLILLAFVLAPLVSQTTWVEAQGQPIQIIEMTAKKYEFSPSPVHIKVGTKVQLKITAVDHDHGFQVTTTSEGAEKPGLVFSSVRDCVQLKKSETTIIEFVAQTPGTYPFRCCHTCGLGHRGMKSQIVVD